MNSFSNTLNRFKKWNFATVRGAFAPRTPCWGRVIAFKWPGRPPPPKKNPGDASACNSPINYSSTTKLTMILYVWLLHVWTMIYLIESTHHLHFNFIYQILASIPTIIIGEGEGSTIIANDLNKNWFWEIDKMAVDALPIWVAHLTFKRMFSFCKFESNFNVNLKVSKVLIKGRF